MNFVLIKVIILIVRLFNDGINDGVLQLAIKSWNLIKALKCMDLSWKAAHHLIFIYLNKKSIASAASVLEESKLLTEEHINNLSSVLKSFIKV